MDVVKESFKLKWLFSGKFCPSITIETGLKGKNI